MIKFNIGSAVNGVDRMISPLQAAVALWEHGFEDITLGKVEQSSTETTYVITAARFNDKEQYEGIGAAVYAVCEALQQDAIAYKIVDDKGAYVGYLVGPKAKEWGGAFIPEYFID